MQYANDTQYDSLHVWLAVAVVGFLLGAAALALCDTCEARDLTRQGFFIVQTRVL